MPPKQPGDWFPEIVEQVVEPARMARVCRIAGATACVARTRDRCVVYLPPAAPAWMVEHEYLHCFGYDHYPGTEVLFDPELAHNAPRVADLVEFYGRGR